MNNAILTVNLTFKPNLKKLPGMDSDSASGRSAVEQSAPTPPDIALLVDSFLAGRGAVLADDDLIQVLDHLTHSLGFSLKPNAFAQILKRVLAHTGRAAQVWPVLASIFHLIETASKQTPIYIPETNAYHLLQYLLQHSLTDGSVLPGSRRALHCIFLESRNFTGFMKQNRLWNLFCLIFLNLRSVSIASFAIELFFLDIPPALYRGFPIVAFFEPFVKTVANPGIPVANPSAFLFASHLFSYSDCHKQKCFQSGCWSPRSPEF
jgi:hypothetical protein